MIIENHSKSLPWLLLCAAIGLLIYFGLQDPLRLAEAEQKRQAAQQQAAEWQLNLEVLQNRTQAEIDKINNQRWLDEQRTQWQAQFEAGIAQLWLLVAYGGAAIVGLVVSVAALGLTLLALVLLWRRLAGSPWRDPLYWQRQRELARELERQRRAQPAAPVPEPASLKSNGHGQTAKLKREKHPPI